VIRGLVYVVYVVLWLVIVRTVLRVVARLFGAPGASARPSAGSRPPLRPAEDLVRDRVCNTYVPRSRALVATIGGREEHFCSAACRDEARAAVPRVS